MVRWALICIAAIAAIVAAGGAMGETPVERGSYLVNGILTCGQTRLLSRHHRTLHGMPHADSERQT